MDVSVNIFVWLFFLYGVMSENNHENNKITPNILFILADDWGWGDIGVYGASSPYHVTGTQVSTPNLDRFAAQGTLFTDFHVAQSFCAPSRTSFMTGRFPADLSVNYNWDMSINGWIKNKELGLPYFVDPKLPNVAQVLHDNGYATAHFGKWHLGGFSPPNMSFPLPSQYGFDITATHTSVVFTNKSLSNKQNIVAGNRSDRWWSSDVDAVCINHTKEFIHASLKQGKRFYVNLWLHMSHDTIDPRPEWLEPYPFKNTCLFAAKQAGETICPGQIYWGAQTATDARVGDLIKEIDSLGIRNETLIVFSTDNGAQSRTWTKGGTGRLTGVMDSAIGVQGPFRGCKASLYDGGHRVPFIVSWPGTIPTGRVDHSLLSSVDWLPTIATITKSKIPKGTLLRGVDVSDILFGKKKKCDTTSISFALERWWWPSSMLEFVTGTCYSKW